jgi:hypothetical protein
MVLNALENLLVVPTVKKKYGYYPVLAPDSWKMHRRSMIILFYGYVSTDSADDNALFSALQHLRHNKHKVVLSLWTPRQSSSSTLIIL